MRREDLFVGQKVILHEPRNIQHPGEVVRIGRTLVTIKNLDVRWNSDTQYYISTGTMKGPYGDNGYFFRTPEAEEEHVAYETAMAVLKRHGFEAYRVQDKQKVIAAAGLLLNQFESQ